MIDTTKRIYPISLSGFLVCLNSVLSAPVLAQEYEPIVQPLEVLQKIEQITNAPNGLDDIEIEPTFITTLPKTPSTASIPSQLEAEVSESLDEVTLEEKIQEQSVQKELSQFGYDFFTATPTTFVPVTNLPIPFDYRVGPGDNVVIQLYGKKNVEYRLVVHRDGRLLIPDFGPFEVNGMTFQELKATLQELLEKGLIGTKVVVTMADIRTIQIVVAGEVKQPGRYTISGLSTLFNALLNSGGVKRTGSLRNIQLKRLGVTVATFDLYDVLLRGDSSSDVRLQQNDILFVPSIGSTVGIGGEIQRPAIYELKGEQTLGEIITMAGNLLPAASLEESHIERISSNGYRTIVELDDSRGETSAMLETPVIQGDIIRVLSVTDTMRDIVVLSGHVARPGGYQFTPGKRIRDVITGVDNLLPNADLNFSLLRREIPSTRKIEVKYVDLGKMLADPESDANIVLQSRDELFVFERARSRTRPIENIVEQLKHQVEEHELPMTVQVRGNTRHTGEFPLQENSRLDKVISLAGGMLPGSDRDYVLVTRTNPITRQLSMFSIKYDPASSSRIEARNPVILPADRIYVFDRNSDRSELIREDLDRLVEQTRYGELSPVVFVDGPVRIPGRYPYELGMELADLIRAAGGLKEKAYGHVAELTRFEFLDNEYQQVYHEQLDLEQILVSGSHYEIYPYDHLTLMPKPNWSDTSKVAVTGEVRFPGTYIIKPGESLCNLIQRIGGFKPSAYLYGSIYTRESVRQRQQAAFDRLQDQLDDLLVQLHVSPSALNMEKMPSREDNHEMIQVINQLKSKKASGRMVVDVEGAQECGTLADIEMENGDTLHVPVVSNEVNVMGQVYYPSSHRYQEDKGSRFYINLSGGNTDLGHLKHGYVLQANGDVISMRPNSIFRKAKNVAVSRGATVYVPINVDRINGLEKAQSWTKSVFQLAIAAAVL